MREVIIKNENIEVGIKIHDTTSGITWKEVMVLVIDGLTAHTYVSQELDNLREEWSE